MNIGFYKNNVKSARSGSHEYEAHPLFKVELSIMSRTSAVSLEGFRILIDPPDSSEMRNASNSNI